MFKKTISTLCIILGLVLLFYPWVKDCYINHQQHRIMQKWRLAMEQMALGDKPAVAVAGSGVREGQHPGAPPDGSIESAEADKKITDQVEGILMINKIGLEQPILKGATPANLAISVASIENTAKAGSIGNYAIAGHRNYGYGTNFNRLDELQNGDIIEVERSGYRYRYEVKQKLVVRPDEVWVLEPSPNQREITLVTCHPVKNPTQRLIVKGKLVEN